MIEHKDTIGKGEVYGNRSLASFHKKLFLRGAKINISSTEDDVFLEAVGSAMAWVLTKGGSGGKITVPMSVLKDLNIPTVSEMK